MSASTASWQEALDHWLEPFLARLNRSAQKRWMATYLKGLMLPGERKSIEPMAARVAPGAVQQLHHFVSTSPWLTGPLEDELIRQADRLLGGPDAVLVIDDTALPKQGVHSVGVARQYCGCLGKRANGQVLVSLTLARDEVPIPIVLRLFLPEKWVDDPARCDAAGVPEDRRRRLAKPDLALEELDRVRALGVRFSAVLTDAGYGISAAFRQALSARELVWAAGIPRIQKVFPSEVVMVRPVPKRGRSRQTAIPATEAITAETMLKSRPWRTITWREGTKGPLTAAFARRRAGAGSGRADGALARAQQPASTGRGGVARGRAPHVRRAQVLPVEPACPGDAEAARGYDQGALGLRAGAPAAQGGAWARPSRVPELASAAPSRPVGDAGLHVPAAAAVGGKNVPAARPVEDRHRDPRCPRCVGRSSWP
jgi:SRSO17 transposase